MKHVLLLATLSFLLTNCAPGESTFLTSPNADNSNTSAESKIKSEKIIKPKVDILFVLDNSGSMADNNETLKLNISQFVSSFTQNDDVDYQISTTTVYDSDYFSRDSFIKKYGEVQNGRLSAVITPDTSDHLEKIFNVEPANSGQAPIYEELFSPVKAVLTNNKFIREDSLFVLVLVSDAETSDRDIAASELKDLISKKSNDNFLTFAAISRSVDKDGCFKDFNSKGDIPKNPVRVESFIEQTDGKTFSLCSKDFGEELTDFGLEIKKKLSTKSFKLKSQPDIKSLEVTMNGKLLAPDQEIGWTYDSDNKLIKINDGVDFEGTALIEINYKPINASDYINNRVVIMGR